MPDDEDNSYEGNEQEQEQDQERELDGEQVRVSLLLSPELRERHPHWRVSEAPLAVPSGLTRSGLSAVLKQLLAEQNGASLRLENEEEDGRNGLDSNLQFDFLVGRPNQQKPASSSYSSSSFVSSSGSRLLRGGIEAQARKLGLSLEEAVPVVYFPLINYRPSDAPVREKLPDWIAALQFDPASRVVTAACYDGSLHCYRERKEEEDDVDARRHRKNPVAASPLTPVASIRAHVGAVKCCAVHKQRHGQGLVIATGAMDHSLRLHQLFDRREANDHGGARLERLADCVGHLASVEAVAFAPDQGDDDAHASLRLASGDFSGAVCLWTHSADPASQQASTRKKAKTSTSTSTAIDAASTTSQEVSPAVSLQAHAGNVSGLSFGNHLFRYSSSPAGTVKADRLVTGSWDHSIKLWDVERQDNLLTLNGSRVVSCLDTSYHTEGIVATGHPDCTIRLWDVRVGSSGSPIATADQTTWRPSHRAWITSVAWSVESPYHLLSSSHDGTVKLWDLRASLPYQSLRVVNDKEDKVLCAAFGRRDARIYAGGTDGEVRSYDSSLVDVTKKL